MTSVRHLLPLRYLRHRASGIIAPRYLSTNSQLKQHSATATQQVQHPTRTNRILTNKLELIEPSHREPVAEFRVLNEDGTLAGEVDSALDNERILELYKGMVQLNCMDQVLFDSQRQGRISFYMTSFGEEAAQFGSAGALTPADWIYAQYREPGIILQRGYTLKQALSQCYGNIHDLGKGRQMPIHYGSKALNFVTLSSPLATQMPQAAGTAYALRMKAKTETGDAANSPVVACYFGEGAASEGDAHAALNFASTLDCPVLFFCRNNGYAISTPASEQFRGDGIVLRALGYGMPALRVDGNDLFAVFAATKMARELSTRESRPVLLEAMTYRLGHHSTSDDSSAYRSAAEVNTHEANGHPIQRVYRYLLNNGLWNEQREADLRKEARENVLEALSSAEREKKPPISTMFEDVYHEKPEHLERQCEELRAHLEEYGGKYSVDDHVKF